MYLCVGLINFKPCDWSTSGEYWSTSGECFEMYEQFVGSLRCKTYKCTVQHYRLGRGCKMYKFTAAYNNNYNISL